MTPFSSSPTRRDFLKSSSQVALGTAALPFAASLAAMSQAAAFTTQPGDYKALICVFLYGANDFANTVVTYDNSSYDKYSLIRGGGAGRTAGGIALGQNDLTATLLNPTVAPVDSMGVTRQFALHPKMMGLTNLFNTNKAAVQLNVGPLIKPLTRVQYNSTNLSLYPRPPRLFSHNDQQSIWQSSSPEGSKIGWGGNMGDLAIANGLNSNTLFSCISVTGNSVFLAGDQALQYQVSTGGAVKLNATASPVYGSSFVKDAIATLIQQNRSHVLENQYTKVTMRSAVAETSITSALGLSPLATVFQNDSLSQQLKMVARLIKGRSTLGARRQVFMVSLGGFDTHDNLLTTHDKLLKQVDDALTAFYNATVEIGVSDKVTAFTASDFGRTLASNGDGSDHGWGNHHLMVGGAVQGKAFYGVAPPVSVSDAKDIAGNYLPENQWHVGQGRLLPSTSVDQYAATLARWFGVQDSDMPNVLPNLNNFGGAGYPIDLGFML